MRRKLFITCCALLVAQVVAAQASDPISGKWTGDIGLTEANRNAVTFDLKLDANGAITGTVTGPGPAEFKGGTYDRKTGALKFDVDVLEEGRANRFVFEGTAVGGVVTGRATGNGETGTFRLMRSTADFGQKSDGSSSAAELREGFGEVHGWVSKAAELVPADKYTFRPAESVRTFGQQIGHIADSYNYYCARAAGQNVQWSDSIEKGSTDKATVMAKLKQSVDTCNTAYSNGGQTSELLSNIGHTSLHYGNIVTYMRMLGLVPPSS